MKYLKISIITPSYNQGKFIERTIQSVLDQNYPNLEYRILDSLSTDSTKKILTKYKKKAKIIIKKDNGQRDAINKGMKIAKGEIIGYLNSDDTLEPGALYVINDFFTKNPKANFLMGKCNIIDEKDKPTRPFITIFKNLIPSTYRYKPPILYIFNFITQPSTFWRKKVVKKIGLMDETLKLAFDYDYFLRISQKFPLHFLPKSLANFRIHKDQKSSNHEKHFEEDYQVAAHYIKSPTVKILAFLSRKVIILSYKLMDILKI